MITILVDGINAFVFEGTGIDIEMQKILDAFPNPKIILTGANDEQFKHFGLDKMPYEVFTLKHDPEKTDPAYYETLLQQYNLKSDDVIYFEHSKEASESARSVGIKTMFYDHNKRDLAALKKFLEEHLNS